MALTREQALEEADAILQSLLASGDEEIIAAASGPDGKIDFARLIPAIVATRKRLADKLMERGSPMVNPLMGYLSEVPAPANRQTDLAAGADKYVGAVADGYDAKREASPKWQAEQRIIESFLADLPAGSTVLDIPVGTGRFLPFYIDKGFTFIGVDASADMLVKALLKVAKTEQVQAWIDTCSKAGRVVPAMLENKHEIVQGDVRAIKIRDKAVDAAVMVRLTRWLDPNDCQLAFRELQRVSRHRVIWTARVGDHPHARPLQLFEDVRQAGWAITRNEAGHEDAYRILMAERA